MKKLLAILILFAGFTASANIAPALAVRAILGEASNQSQPTMNLVACALRNRGTLTGVYGVDNPVVNRATPKLIARAARAWQKSATQKLLPPAVKFFGCDADRPYLVGVLKLKPVLKSGGITFYRA